MSDMPKMPDTPDFPSTSYANDCNPDSRVVLASDVSELHFAWQQYAAALEARLAALREQVMWCVPDKCEFHQCMTASEWKETEGHNRCRAETLANLQALFGERQDD